MAKYQGFVSPQDSPDWLITRGRFCGLKVYQKSILEDFEKKEDNFAVRNAQFLLSTLPKEARFKSKTIYVPPTLTVGRHLLRFHSGGFVNMCGLENAFRGDIRTFSRSSQKRLRDALEEYDFNPNFFITLTYPPAVAPEDMEVAFYQLRDFCRTVDRLHAGKSRPLWIWKKEFQKNGNVHFHLVSDIFFDLKKFDGDYFLKFPRHYNKKAKKEYINLLSSSIKRFLNKGVIYKLQKIWSRVINDDAKNSFDISAVLSDNGISQYMAKYVDKNDVQVDCPEHIAKCGRWWGVFNRKFYRRVYMRKYTLLDGLDYENVNKPLSARDNYSRGIFTFLHDFLDSDKYYKIWRSDLKYKKYVKNEWFLPKDKLKYYLLDRFFLTYLNLFDIFIYDESFLASTSSPENSPLLPIMYGLSTSD